MAAHLRLLAVHGKDREVPDTYKIEVKGRGWLACTAVSHLHYGGWLRSVAEEAACPFKLIQDSSCNTGTCCSDHLLENGRVCFF